MEYNVSSANQTISPSGLKILNFWQTEREQRLDKKNGGGQKGIGGWTRGTGGQTRGTGGRTRGTRDQTGEHELRMESDGGQIGAYRGADEGGVR